MRIAAPQAMTIALLLWPVVLLGVMMFRLQHRQQHETASDLRAVALTGDSEALVRALTKLHAFARVPRRWEMEVERRATHPSLARRIQAIRAAAGTSPASLGMSATFAAADGNAAVTFHDDRLEWHEGSETTHTINYGQLMELRLHARGLGTLRLVAVDSQKRRWEIPLKREDTARAQAVLDIVDMRLAKIAEPPAVSIMAVRLLVWMTITAAATVGQFAVVLTAVLAIAQAASPLTAAAGASAVAAAVLTASDHPMWITGMSQVWVAIALFVPGSALLGVAFVNRREPSRLSTGRLARRSFSSTPVSGTSSREPHSLNRLWIRQTTPP